MSLDSQARGGAGRALFPARMFKLSAIHKQSASAVSLGAEADVDARRKSESSILGVGKLEQRAVVRDGAVVARPMAYVTLTIDHRVLDGFSANKFLTRWVETIENWK